VNTNTYNHLTISEDAVHMPGGGVGGGGAELAGFENGNPPQIGMPWAGGWGVWPRLPVMPAWWDVYHTHVISLFTHMLYTLQ
jgi:hypothetical protein